MTQLTEFSKFSKFSDLVSATRLAGRELRNPIAVAPMSRVSAAAGGTATERMARYYGEFARGGFGLVITEGLYPDDRYAQAYPAQPGLSTDEQAASWRPVVDAVHAAGGLVVAQLMHAGALSQTLPATIAPSAVEPKGRKMSGYGGGSGEFAVPAAATGDDIRDVIAGFASAARRARHAGFDGVEIHAANGYLLDQFITDYTNLRTDAYGAGAAGRARIAGEVLAAVRAEVGPGFVVGIRISQAKVNDAEHRWTEPDAREILAVIAAQRPDYVHVAGEGADWASAAAVGTTTLTRLAREIVGVPVIANGSLHEPAAAQKLLVDGEADLIAIGRAAIVNPDWPARVAEGRELRPWDRNVLSPTADLATQDARLTPDMG